MNNPKITSYYLREHHSDLELAKFDLFEIAFYEILHANGGDESDPKDFQLAASQALGIIDKVSADLAENTTTSRVEIE